jgi:hypothetical protein
VTFPVTILVAADQVTFPVTHRVTLPVTPRPYPEGGGGGGGWARARARKIPWNPRS